MQITGCGLRNMRIFMSLRMTNNLISFQNSTANVNNLFAPGAWPACAQQTPIRLQASPYGMFTGSLWMWIEAKRAHVATVHVVASPPEVALLEIYSDQIGSHATPFFPCTNERTECCTENHLQTVLTRWTWIVPLAPKIMRDPGTILSSPFSTGPHICARLLGILEFPLNGHQAVNQM